MYRILVCDDDADIVSALNIYLTAEGYETVLCRSGAEAVAAALYIVGEKEQAKQILSKFNWREQFLILNRELLERYSEAETSQEVVAIQWEYCDPPEDADHGDEA